MSGYTMKNIDLLYMMIGLSTGIFVCSLYGIHCAYDQPEGLSVSICSLSAAGSFAVLCLAVLIDRSTGDDISVSIYDDTLENISKTGIIQV